MAAAIEVRGVSKRFKLYHEHFKTLKERLIFFRSAHRFEEFWAVKDVTLEVSAGQTFGLVGANGSGKTTLLKMIAGILRPTEGQIRIRGRVAPLLELGAGFHPDLTGRENVFLNGSIMGLSRREISAKFDAIVAFAELEPFIDNPVRNYSSGMYLRLGFAVAIHMDPDILLVDEVLAVGDEAFQQKCLERIRSFQAEGRTILVVTHAVDLVREMCNEAAMLDHGELAALGNPSEVVRTYRDRVATTPAGKKVSVLGSIEFTDVTLLDPEGQPAEVFFAGQSMTVVAELVAHTDVCDPVFSLNIHDSAGQHVFGTNSHWRYMKVDLDAGPARLRVDFPMIPMREGLFTLTVGVHSRDALTLYAITDRKTRFEARSPNDEPGRLFLPCTFSLDGAAVKEEEGGG
ncbi:MAG: ABC transporter ATP-binding protein [Actinomycetota bacterium]